MSMGLGGQHLTTTIRSTNSIYQPVLNSKKNERRVDNKIEKEGNPKEYP